MAILLSLLPYLAAGLALFGAWRTVDGWCNGACQDAQEQAQEARSALTAYQEQARAQITALALLWDDKRKESESHAREAEQERGKTFAALEDRARAVRGAIRIGSDAATQRLLADAAAAAAAASAGPPGAPEAAPSVPAPSAEEYIVQLYRWGASGWARVTDWETFYKGLQDAASPD